MGCFLFHPSRQHSFPPDYGRAVKEKNCKGKVHVLHSRNLPSDPFPYLAHLPDAENVVIKFYHYGPFLAKVPIYGVMTEALQDVREHQEKSETFIGTKDR